MPSLMIFSNHLKIAINQLLQTELAEFLGYERYSYAGINTGNNRNGSYERSFDAIICSFAFYLIFDYFVRMAPARINRQS